MHPDEEILDEGVRHRIRALSVGVISPLGEEQRSALAQRLSSEGPARIRQARMRRNIVRSAGVAFSVLLVGALATSLMRHNPPGDLRSADRSLSGDRTLDRTAVVDRTAVALRCSSFASFPEQTLDATDARDVLLGERARVILDPEARAEITATSPCRTLIHLRQGRVTVHARDLGGGELIVRTEEASVVVHGTIFAVETNKDALTVEVLEGLVEVTSGKESGLKLAGGDSMRALKGTGKHAGRGTTSISRGSLSGARQASMRLLVEQPTRDSPTTVTRSDRRISRRNGGTRHSPLGELRSRSDARNHPSDAPREREARGFAGRTIESSSNVDSLEDLLARGARFASEGRVDLAREAYREAGAGRGLVAETAWIALARMEIELGEVDAARNALRQRATRFGAGSFGAESLWLLLRAQELEEMTEDAEKTAHQILRDHPSAPQARAAKDWLERTRGHR